MCHPYGWVFRPKFSKQGSLFRPIFHKHGVGYPEIGENSKKMSHFLPKFIIKVGMTASFGNEKRVPF